MLFQEDKMRKVQINRLGKYPEYEVVKKERNCSLKHLFFLRSPLCRKIFPEKVSLCTSLKRLCGKSMARASMSVETALVLPLFFLGVVTMISFMDIYKLQTEHLTKLCERAKEAGMYAYVPDGGGPDEITLPDIYSYKPIGGLIPLPSVWTCNQVKVHAWTGRDEESFSEGGGENSEESEKMVYITESGGVRHKDLGCSYLDLSVNQISGSSIAGALNEHGEHYAPCEICSRNQTPSGTVFITKQGNRYHNLGSCSGLKRTVRMVKESDASDMPVCSRCG